MSTSKNLSILVNKMVSSKAVQLTPEAHTGQQLKAQTRRQSLALKDNSFFIRCIDKDSRILLSPTCEKYIGQTFIAAPNDILTTDALLDVRCYRDKTYGNNYFAARLYVNGELVYTMPFQYEANVDRDTIRKYFEDTKQFDKLVQHKNVPTHYDLKDRPREYFDSFEVSYTRDCKQSDVKAFGKTDK